MLKDILTHSLPERHQQAGLELEEYDDHTLVITVKGSIQARLNTSAVGEDDILKAADTVLKEFSGGNRP